MTHYLIMPFPWGVEETVTQVCLRSNWSNKHNKYTSVYNSHQCSMQYNYIEWYAWMVNDCNSQSYNYIKQVVKIIQ